MSDRLVHAPGFRLEWVIEGTYLCENLILVILFRKLFYDSNCLSGCSAHLTRPTGEISTPGYPNAYPDSTVCEWKIQVDFNQSVELHIEKFYFEKSVNCEYDSLKVLVVIPICILTLFVVMYLIFQFVLLFLDL